MKSDFALTPFRKLVEFVYPQNCSICGEGGELICEECLGVLPRARLKCLKCGRRNVIGTCCPACKNKYKPERVIAVFKFSSVIRELIHELKYDDVTTLREPLAQKMAETWETRDEKVDIGNEEWVVTAVPLSKSKRRYRGYNQAELLAKTFAEKSGLIFADILERKKIKRGRSQVQSGSKEERRKNVKDVFAPKKNAKVPEKVILVDDVITTGATAEEAVRVLKKNGVKKVIVLGLAMG